MAEELTGIRNEKYDLISVLYHIAQGAQTYETYAKDAEKAGDDELARYFRDVREEHRKLAERGEMLLSQRLRK